MTDHEVVLTDGSVLNLKSEDNNLNLEFDISINPGPPSEGQDYNKLRNKPQINSTVLEGDLALEDLDLRAIRYNTTAYWNSFPQLESKAGAIYVYSDYKVVEKDGVTTTIPGIKIGDGNAYLIDLPFVSDNESQQITEIEHTVEQLAQELEEHMESWNNKVTTVINPANPEELIFTKM